MILVICIKKKIFLAMLGFEPGLCGSAPKPFDHDVHCVTQ